MKRAFLGVVALGLLGGCQQFGGALLNPLIDRSVALTPVSDGPGALTLDGNEMFFDDGTTVPIRKLDLGQYGVYYMPSRPARLANGRAFCGDDTVAYFTLHRTSDGLVAMNVGDFTDVPEPPPADVVQLPDACATYTFHR